MLSLLGKRIFMVEDNPANKTIQILLLERNGAKVEIVRWESDIVAHLRKYMPIDLVMLDLMFPNGITGYQLFEEIRTHSEFDNIPIVAVSASNPSEAIPKTREYGFNGFISKPVDFDNFPKQINQLIDGKSVWIS